MPGFIVSMWMILQPELIIWFHVGNSFCAKKVLLSRKIDNTTSVGRGAVLYFCEENPWLQFTFGYELKNSIRMVSVSIWINGTQNPVHGLALEKENFNLWCIHT